MAVSSRRRLVHRCVLLVAIVSAVFWVFGGAVSPIKRFGPVTVWFRSWEGNVAVPDPRAEYELTFQPKKPSPQVLAVKVSAGPGEVGEVRFVNGETIAQLPDERNQLKVLDWYGGKCDLQFVPKSVTGGEIRIKWVFGY